MDLATFSDDELERLRVSIRAEQEARAAARQAPAQAAAVVDAVASGRTPDPITVTGPDGRGWRVVVESTDEATSGPPEWGATTAYATGAEVTETGRRYTALQDSTGKQPSASPTYWRGL